MTLIDSPAPALSDADAALAAGRVEPFDRLGSLYDDFACHSVSPVERPLQHA